MPVATIIQAVSPPSILLAGAGACAKAGAAVSQSVTANPTRRPIPVRMTVASLRLVMSCREVSWRSKRVVVRLAGADADRVLERRDEDLAVADLAGARRGGERLDH